MAATTCEICDFTYCTDIGSDGRRHNTLHAAAVDARETLRGVGPEALPISYREREDLKRPRCGQDPLHHAVLVVWSHFARSLAAPPWNYDTRRHPSFERYAQAYIAQPSTREAWGDAVTDALIVQFGGARTSARLPNGMSYWRRRQKGNRL
jgi:hypothetical protein